MMMEILFKIVTSIVLYKAANLLILSVNQPLFSLFSLFTLGTIVALYEFIDSILPAAEDIEEAIVRYYVTVFVVGFTIGQAMIYIGSAQPY